MNCRIGRLSLLVIVATLASNAVAAVESSSQGIKSLTNIFSRSTTTATLHEIAVTKEQVFKSVSENKIACGAALLSVGAFVCSLYAISMLSKVLGCTQLKSFAELLEKVNRADTIATDLLRLQVLGDYANAEYVAAGGRLKSIYAKLKREVVQKEGRF